MGCVINGQLEGRNYWPDALIPYRIGGHFEPDELANIQSAVDHWNDATILKIVPESTLPPIKNRAVMEFVQTNNSCSSGVGRPLNADVRKVNIGPDCGVESVIHEIGHSIGLWHEQSRQDRDEFVTIQWKNIKPAKKHNFDQHTTDGADIGHYDYDSIMHYPQVAFSVAEGLPTITTKHGEVTGRGQSLSKGDIDTASIIYAAPKDFDEQFVLHISKTREEIMEGVGNRYAMFYRKSDGMLCLYEIVYDQDKISHYRFLYAYKWLTTITHFKVYYANRIPHILAYDSSSGDAYVLRIDLKEQDWSGWTVAGFFHWPKGLSTFITFPEFLGSTYRTIVVAYSAHSGELQLFGLSWEKDSIVATEEAKASLGAGYSYLRQFTDNSDQQHLFGYRASDGATIVGKLGVKTGWEQVAHAKWRAGFTHIGFFYEFSWMHLFAYNTDTGATETLKMEPENTPRGWISVGSAVWHKGYTDVCMFKTSRESNYVFAYNALDGMTSTLQMVPGPGSRGMPSMAYPSNDEKGWTPAGEYKWSQGFSITTFRESHAPYFFAYKPVAGTTIVGELEPAAGTQGWRQLYDNLG